MTDLKSPVPSPAFSRRDAAAIAIVVALFLTLLAGVVTFQNARRLSRHRELVAEAHQTITSLESLFSTLKDAETGQRGFLLTGDATYLAPYQDALPRLNAEMATLKKFVADDPAQQQRLARIEQNVATKLAELKQTIDLTEGGSRPEALDVVREDSGKQFMDEVRGAVAEMKRTEEKLLNDRSREANRSYRLVVASIALSTLLTMGLIAAVYLLSHRNVRARERSAAIIAEQAERLRTTLASIGDGVISTDIDARVISLNAVAESLTGWANEDAVGRPLSEIFRIENETTRQPAVNPVDRALKEGIIVGLANHTILIAKDGTERAIDDSAAPIRCKDGEIVGCVLIFRDIAEQRAAAKSLALSEARKTAMLESALDCIVTCDENGLIIDFNPAAERTFGYRREEMVGKALSDTIVPVSLRDMHREGMERFMKTRQSQILGQRLVLSGRHADGTEFPVELAVIAIPGTDPPHFTAYIRDITARKAMEDELRLNASELSEANRRKNEFIAMLAHELRNPLAPIRNALDVISLSQTDPDSLTNAARMIDRQVNQMVRFVDDLLDISRISQGRIELRRGKMQLASAVNHAIEAARPLYDAREVELSVNLPSQPLYLNADPARITQVVGNLLNNACKFTDKGGRVEINVEPEDDQAVIRVQDNGIGIAPDQIAPIFELFTQVDTSLERSVSGLGIGLTLVRNLVERHDGTIEARSDGLGHGSEFIVRLPLLKDAAPDPPPAPAKPALAKISARVLVIDDNQDSANSLAKLMSLRGAESQTAFDGASGVDAAAEFKPEVILCDIGLPKLNGYEVARKIREQPWGKDIVLVALTGWGQNEDRERSTAAGFDAHLVKPVDLASLLSILADRLPQRE